MPTQVVCSCGLPLQIREGQDVQQVRCFFCGQILTLTKTPPEPESPDSPEWPGSPGSGSFAEEEPPQPPPKDFQQQAQVSSDEELVGDKADAPGRGNRFAFLLFGGMFLFLALGVITLILVANPWNPQGGQVVDKHLPVSPTPSPGPDGPGSPTVPPPKPVLPVLVLEGHKARILGACFSKDGESIFSSSGGQERKDGQKVLAGDRSLRQWNATTGHERQRLDDFPTGLEAVAFSPDGRLAAIAASGRIQDGLFLPDQDRDVHLWDLSMRKEVCLLVGHTRGILCVAFSADSRRLLTGSLDQTACLWDVASGNLLFTLKGHSGPVVAAALSPDGRLGLTGSTDKTARLWNLDKGTELHQLAGHADAVSAVSINASGQVAATGGAGMVEIRLWDVRSGKELRRLVGESGAVHALAFVPDGTRLLSGAHDGLRLWQVASGQLLKRYDGHSEALICVASAPDGRRAVTGDADGALQIWELPEGVAELVRALQDATQRQPGKVLAELRQMGPDARQAVPALLKLCAEATADFRKDIVDALDKIGTPERSQAALLIPLLADPSVPSARRYALDTLTTLGPDASTVAVIALTKLLRDSDVTLRRKAVVLLGQIGPSARSQALTGLIELLHDSDAAISQAAASALEQLGSATKSEVPFLQRLLADALPEVRRFALLALTELAGEAAEAVPALLLLVAGEKRAELRLLGLAALLQIEPRSKTVVEACGRLLDDSEAAVRRQAVGGLAAARREAVAQPGLLRALPHSDAEVSKAANEALADVTLAKSQIPTVKALLARPGNKAVQLRLLDLLTRMGPDAVAALPSLRGMLKDTTGDVRLKAIQAVAALGPAGREAGAELAPLLQESSHQIKREASVALVQIEAKQVEQAVPFLVRSLRLENAEGKAAQEERNRAGQVLIKIGRPAVDRLIEALEGEFDAGNLGTPQGQRNADARLAVVQILGGIGSKDKAPAILLALSHVEGRDPVQTIRAAARQARIEIQKAKEK